MTRFGTEDRNVARLSPVIALNRIPAGLVGWTKQLQLDDHGAINMTCIAGRNHVVPHGMDADILFALTTLYFLQGKQAFGRINVSVHDLCTTAGLKPGGTTFERVRESLQRWLRVTYQVVDCWATPTKNGKWNFRSLSFGMVTSVEQVDLEVEDTEILGAFQATTMLQITLSPQLIASLSAGHVRSVDLEFYAKLKMPLSRVLYRTLEEQRALMAQGASTFRVPLSAWGDHLGMRSLSGAEMEVPSPDGTSRIPVTEVMNATRLRRALAPAHQELQAHNYLKAVDYVGRGNNQRLDYTFGVPTQPVDLELVSLLKQRHINLKQAELYARTYCREEIEAATAKYDARSAAGYKPHNPGGFMADILNNPDKYPTVVQENGSNRVLNPKATAPAPEPEPAPPEREAKSALMSLNRHLDETTRARAVRDRLVALYLQYKVETLDLIKFSNMDLSEVEQAVTALESDAG